jgi:hypothetical protein
VCGENSGIYEVDISRRKCIPLLLGVGTAGAIFARDGKSFLYAVSSHGQILIYRQLWKDGKLIGTPQVALELPFTFSLSYGYGGLSYDFSRAISLLFPHGRPGRTVSSVFRFKDGRSPPIVPKVIYCGNRGSRRV